MEDKIWNCIIKRLTGMETEDSKSFLDLWLAEDAAHIQKYNEAKSLWILTASIPHENEVRPFNQLYIMQHNSNQAIASSDQFSLNADKEQNLSVVQGKEQLVFWKYGIAAVLVMAVLLTVLYQYKDSEKKEEWITKKASAGKMIMVSLPDSSKIWLNSGTEIRFLRNFNEGKLRALELVGEAYFNVTHDEKHPFVVKSGKLNTIVYGTSFNVRAYRNEPEISVAVNSGKVGVLRSDDGHKSKPFLLLPNDKLVYHNNDDTFAKNTIANRDVDSWLHGDLVFEQTPITEVFETLARKYDVKIVADLQVYKDCRLTARFKNKPIKDVLKTLRIAMNINSKQVEQTIYIKGGTACNKK